MINNIWVLIYKRLNRTASPQELAELDGHLERDEDGKYPVALLERIWEEKNGADVSAGPSEEKWSRLQQKLAAKELGDHAVIAIRPKRNYYKLSWWAAASLILLIGFYQFRTTGPDGGDIVVAAPTGALSMVQLPDGSKVTLNAGSKVTYKNSFDTKHREVYLSGEAFFDVVKDPEHPFIVTTNTIRIKVLGTAFNVRAYPKDKTTEAALLHGSIELTVLKDPDRHILLKPQEKITVLNTVDQDPAITAANSPAMVQLSRIHQRKTDALPSEAIWMENKIAFDGLEFGEIAKMMERKYNVIIVFEDPALATSKLTGRFENISLAKALDQLKFITDFNYTMENNKVSITP